MATLLKVHIGPWLRQRGFRRTGYRFVVWHGGNCQIIKIMTDRRDKTGNPPFGLYLGVFSKRLWYFETDHDPVPKVPDQPDCQWGGFLDQLIPPHEEEWFHLEDAGKVPEVGGELTALLETVALPLLSKVVTDEDLRDYWLTGRSPGLGNIQRLMYLAFLCHEIGPREDVKRFVDELRSDGAGSHAGERALAKVAALVGA